MPKKVLLDDFDEPRMSGKNPLLKYYRMPGVHVKLPTSGAFLPPGTLELTVGHDIPVYPMRSADELLLKSPDALMSGFALEELIRSCVPAIKTPRLISSPDLDVLLVAIRAATYGEVITMTPTCPACHVENEARRNLSYLMANMTFVDPENMVRLTDEIVVYVRPYNMADATVLGMASYEEARKLQAMENAPAPERSEQISHSMQRMGLLSNEVLAACVIRVVVPDGDVTNPGMIKEFIANVSKAWTELIQAKLDDINSRGIPKGYDLTCAACGHEWKADIEFNPISFFAASSSV